MVIETILENQKSTKSGGFSYSLNRTSCELFESEKVSDANQPDFFSVAKEEGELVEDCKEFF